MVLRDMEPGEDRRWMNRDLPDPATVGSSEPVSLPTNSISKVSQMCVSKRLTNL